MLKVIRIDALLAALGLTGVDVAGEVIDAEWTEAVVADPTEPRLYEGQSAPCAGWTEEGVN